MHRGKQWKYILTEGGYYIGENVQIEESAYIERGCLIGHDVYLKKNVEITAGEILGGFVHAEENIYTGVNASVWNRVSNGANAVIGMGIFWKKGDCFNIPIFTGALL